MLKRSDTQEQTPALEKASEPSVSPTLDEPNPDELGRLRDILFGSQSRTIEKRLADLESGLKMTRQDMMDLVTDKLSALADSTSSQFAETRREFIEKLDKQGSDQATQTRSVQKELSERIDRQTADQAAQLSAVQKQLSDSIEKLAADMLRQIRESHKELSDRMDKAIAEQSERTRNLQAEARQRDDSLRQEFLSLASSLDGRKTSRHDLGQMLMELGLRLRQDSDTTS
jgi:hypothetical protein